MEGWSNCPFCGGESVIVDDRSDYNARYRRYGRACLAAKCWNFDCGVEIYVYSGKEFPDQKANYKDMVERLRTKWNRRAQ